MRLSEVLGVRGRYRITLEISGDIGFHLESLCPSSLQEVSEVWHGSWGHVGLHHSVVSKMHGKMYSKVCPATRMVTSPRIHP